jgi:hypothetical protein
MPVWIMTMIPATIPNITRLHLDAFNTRLGRARASAFAR